MYKDWSISLCFIIVMAANYFTFLLFFTGALAEATSYTTTTTTPVTTDTTSLGWLERIFQTEYIYSTQSEETTDTIVGSTVSVLYVPSETEVGVTETGVGKGVEDVSETEVADVSETSETTAETTISNSLNSEPSDIVSSVVGSSLLGFSSDFCSDFLSLVGSSDDCSSVLESSSDFGSVVVSSVLLFCSLFESVSLDCCASIFWFDCSWVVFGEVSFVLD